MRLAALAALAGCGDNEGVVVVASPAVVATVAETNLVINATLFAATDAFVPVSSTGVITAEEAAAAAAAAVGRYYPNNCATAVANGPTVTYTLNSCRGPLGVSNLSGTYTVTYTSQANGVQVTTNSTNLTLNGAPVKLNSTAFYTQNGAARSLSVNNQSQLAGAGGNTVTQNQTGTLAWNQGDTCATQNSNSTTTVNGQQIIETEASVLLCTAQCPQSGTVTVAANNGTTGAVHFNGTANPPFVTTGSTAGAVTLTCP
jgi:hypothetical protein